MKKGSISKNKILFKPQNCKYCNGVFFRKRYQIFCSQKCMGQADIALPVVTCTVCDKVFRKTHMSQVYCSGACYNKKRQTITCPLCGIITTEKQDGYCLKCFPLYRRTRTWLNKGINLSVEDFDKLKESQNGKCAICEAIRGSPRHENLFIDHCHKTNKVRGLLCKDCNLGLGLFRDQSRFLSQAAKYLDSHGI